MLLLMPAGTRPLARLIRDFPRNSKQSIAAICITDLNNFVGLRLHAGVCEMIKVIEWLANRGTSSDFDIGGPRRSLSSAAHARLRSALRR
jgi:hypothetical protein